MECESPETKQKQLDNINWRIWYAITLVMMQPTMVPSAEYLLFQSNESDTTRIHCTLYAYTKTAIDFVTITVISICGY